MALITKHILPVNALLRRFIVSLFVSLTAAFSPGQSMAQGWANTAAIQAALAEKSSVVKASWWGFDEKDSTRILQAAINSGAAKVIVENTGLGSSIGSGSPATRKCSLRKAVSCSPSAAPSKAGTTACLPPI